MPLSQSIMAEQYKLMPSTSAKNMIRERCDVVSPQEGVGSARGIWGVEAMEGSMRL